LVRIKNSHLAITAPKRGKYARSFVHKTAGRSGGRRSSPPSVKSNETIARTVLTSDEAQLNDFKPCPARGVCYSSTDYRSHLSLIGAAWTLRCGQLKIITNSGGPLLAASQLRRCRAFGPASSAPLHPALVDAGSLRVVSSPFFGRFGVMRRHCPAAHCLWTSRPKVAAIGAGRAEPAKRRLNEFRRTDRRGVSDGKQQRLPHTARPSCGTPCVRMDLWCSQ
jgi:hypothetical protein